MKPTTLAIILGFASALSGQAAATSEDNQPDAEIRTRQIDQSITLRAVFVPHGRYLRGTYQMTVEKSGASGRSSINQGGNFETGGDAENVIVLATSQVSRARNDQIKAELVVTLSDGTVYTDHYIKDQSD